MDNKHITDRGAKKYKIMTNDITIALLDYTAANICLCPSRMALVGMLPYGVVSSWSIFSLRKSGIYCKRKRDWRLFEVGGTSFVWGFQQFLNINGTKPRINYYRQSYYFAIWNINYSHLAIRRPFVAAVLCLPWYSVIWIDQHKGSNHWKLF